MRLLLLVAALALASCGHQVRLLHQAPATFGAEPGGFESARIIRVIDGDTIEVEITARTSGPGAGSADAGNIFTVRLLGIDTPESVKPNHPVECFGREAAAAAAALLEGRMVRLVKDVEETDGFDRLLRYVYIGDEMANARLVGNGYAHALTYPPNVRHAELLVALEHEARSEGRGLWDSAACN